jgi:phosphatidylserine decarboxylase
VKHQGKALGAAAAMVSRAVLVVIFLTAFLSFVWPKSFWVAAGVAFLGLVFTLFTLYFFRDPNPRVPTEPGLVVAPGHGKVDVVDELDEPTVMRGRCRRISIFLSVFDVHVQQAPVAGEVTLVRQNPGQFLNALKTESATHNENVLIGLRASDPAGTLVGVRLIAGLIARRIIPWLQTGETVLRGERISLIQFGSRVDLYLPMNAEIRISVGQRVVGGETVLARLTS